MSYEPSAMSYEPSAMSYEPSTMSYPRPTSFAFPSPHPSAVSYPGQENCGDTPNYCEMYGDLGSTCDKTDPTMPYCSTTSCSDDSDCSAPNNLCETSYSFNCVPTCIGEHPLFCARRHHNALLLCSDSGQYRGLCSYRDCWGIHGECGASFVCGQESENYGKCTATLCGDDGDCEPGDWCDNYNYCSPGPTNTFPSKTLSTSPTSFAFPSQHPSTSAYPRPTSFAFPSQHPSTSAYPRPTSFAFPSQHPSTSAYPRPTSFAFPSQHPSTSAYPRPTSFGPTSPAGGNDNCGALNIDYFLDHCSSLWKPLPPIGAHFTAHSCPDVAIDQFLTKCSGLWPHAHTTVNSNKDGMDKLSKFEPASCEVLDIDEFLTECSDIYRYIDARFAALSHPEKAETVGVFDMFDMHSHSILVLSFVSNCILLFVSCWMMNTLRKYQRYQSYQTPVVYVESDSEQPFKQ
eukprot:234302_1